MAKKAKQKFKNRALIALALTCILGFGVGGFGVFNAAVIHGEEYKYKAKSQQLSDITVMARRGSIYDSNMNVLAKSADAWTVFIDPSEIKNEETREIVAKGLSEILEVDYDSVYEKCGREKYSYIRIKRKVEYDKKTELEAFIKANKGLHRIIGFEDDVIRYYPYGNFASTVLGFTADDDVGRSGLEVHYNDVLTGTYGRYITAKNARQFLMSSDYDSYYAATQGASLGLTMDQVIQYYLDSALEQAVVDHGATYGYGIVMETKTGAILAMSTKPDFDANNPYKINNEKVLEEIDAIEDEDEKNAAIAAARYGQWRNRTITDSYEPGSVFKCITAAAALEENVVTTDEMFYCSGSYQVKDRMYHCFRREGHGREDFVTAMKNSCNPIFIEIAQRLGPKTFYKYFDAFGLTEPTGIDLPGESIPKANVTYYTANRFTAVSLASCSFGQSFQLSPIQVINAINAIANNGKLMQPYIVNAIYDETGNKILQTKPTIKRQVISEHTADQVTYLMEQVVKSGTARNGYVAGYRVAGKTGTSEKLPDKTYNISSFCGFAPADDPQITVLIVVDEPKSGAYTGGAVAAPVAAEVIQQTMQYLNVEPQYTEEELAKLDMKAPQLVGSTVAQATKDAKAIGYNVKVIGEGETVLNQTPVAKQVIPKNGIIVLYTDSKSETKKVKVPNLCGLSISDASRVARDAGINIKVSGCTRGTVVSYRQSIATDTEVAMGSIITVSFKTEVNVQD
mgnify:CR=1 FL=1